MSSRRALLGLAGALIVATGCGLESSPEPGAASSPESYEEYDTLLGDWANAYVECARSYGADARVVEDAGGEVTITSAYAQGRPVQDGLDAECVDDVGAPPQAPPLTAEYLAGLYELYVEQAACLRAAGYSVSDPPSRTTWVEGYSGESWNPLMDVFESTGSTFEAQSACPQPDPRDAERRGAQIAVGGSP